MRILLTLAMLGLAGCTCNDANNPAARPRGAKAQRGKMKMKMKGKRKMKGKMKGKAMERVDVKVYFVDMKKLEAGDEDFWVAVDRKVGAKTPAKNAVWQLFKGPDDDETAQGLELLKSGAAGFQDFRLQGNVASLKLREGCDNSGGAITVYDHIVKTLKEFPEIEHVKVFDPEGNTQDAEGEGDSRPACLEP